MELILIPAVQVRCGTAKTLVRQGGTPPFSNTRAVAPKPGLHGSAPRAIPQGLCRAAAKDDIPYAFHDGAYRVVPDPVEDVLSAAPPGDNASELEDPKLLGHVGLLLPYLLCDLTNALFSVVNRAQDTNPQWI